MKSESNWFGVSKEGLRKLIENKGRFFVIAELVQNAWDENTSVVDITLQSMGMGKATLRVADDNPNGFQDISHAYTLYAESNKKSDPTKRGRFNLGEKLVLALCDEATIISTKSAVKFNKDGTREWLSDRTEHGTVFSGIIRMTKSQIAEIESQIGTLIPPYGVKTYYNRREILYRTPRNTFLETLATVFADEEGQLRDTRRQTRVEIFNPKDNEIPMIYELGIPVVESGMPYHVNVMQKVPLNQDRDNVRPAYYRDLAKAVVEHMAENITAEQASEPWVATALEAPEVNPDAVSQIVQTRFGDKVVVFNPTDMEANRRAASEGYTVLAGNTFSSQAWKNVRSSGVVPSSSSVSPTPKAYSDAPDAKHAQIIPESEWTSGMKEVAALSKQLFKAIADEDLTVLIYRKHGALAFYTRGNDLSSILSGTSGPTIGFSYGSVGKAFFNEWQDNLPRILELLIHEFSHHFTWDNRPTDTHHISKQFEDALQNVGAKVAIVALRNPGIFKQVKAMT